jgi:hypothetical protein
MSGSPDFYKLLVILGSLLFETALLILFFLMPKWREQRAVNNGIGAFVYHTLFQYRRKVRLYNEASLPSLFFLCYLCCRALIYVKEKGYSVCLQSCLL